MFGHMVSIATDIRYYWEQFSVGQARIAQYYICLFVPELLCEDVLPILGGDIKSLK